MSVSFERIKSKYQRAHVYVSESDLVFFHLVARMVEGKSGKLIG